MNTGMPSAAQLTVTQELLLLITELDHFKGAWKLFGTLEPERLNVLRKVATIESIGSSTRIEGSKLTDREVEQILLNLKSDSFGSRDEQEVAGYACVCEEICQGFESIVFSENVIKQLHGWLLKFSDKDERHRGEYKKLSNNVEAFDESGKSLGILFETASPFETPMRMEKLVVWTREQLIIQELHPLLVIAVFVVVFLAIHPFQDGNGRLSRLLTTLLLLQAGYLYVPYSSLESVIERNKESYYLALRRTQASLKLDTPDFTSWLTFFLRALQKQKIHLQSKIEREQSVNLHMPELSAQILQYIREHGRVTIGHLETFTKANRNTLKKRLAELVKSKYILQYGKGRATWYTLP
jgi:Fic family protein